MEARAYSEQGNQIVCKAASDPTLKAGDYIMERGKAKKVLHVTRTQGGGVGVIVEPEKCYDRETLMREQQRACYNALMYYIKGVRDGSVEPTEAGEAFLFKELPGKYLGNGRFAGIDG